MFYLDRNTVLTTELLNKLLNKFLTNQKPKLERYKNYYEGKHSILDKSYTDESKACNRIVTNFCKIIADTYGGYICGKAVSYVSNEDITDVQDTLNYNDVAAADMAFLNDILVYGVGYELHWLDENAQDRFIPISPLNSFAIFDNTLDSELLYFVRWYDADNIKEDSNLMYLEVYSKTDKKTYKMNGLGGTLEYIQPNEADINEGKNPEANYYGDVPVSVCYLNDNEENIFNSIITLNDAYNELQSAEIDDFQAWVDSYLQLVGVDADSDDIAEMKKNRVLILPEGAAANWLTKNANDTQIVNLLDNIKKNIFKVTACPDMADETFLAQSGTALAYKLVGFENVASGIVARFKKALQRRVELICNILNLKATDAVWRDISINFKRNLPVNFTELIQLVNSLKGIVSDATLLAQLPFIDDVEAELERLQEQKAANMSLYNFGGSHTHTDTDTDSEEDGETEEATEDKDAEAV